MGDGVNGRRGEKVKMRMGEGKDDKATIPKEDEKMRR